MATVEKTPAKTFNPLKPKSKPGKLKKQSAAYKNLLAQTFQRYWPQLSPDHTEELFAILEKAKSTNPNWFTTKRSTEPRPIYYGLQSSCRRIQTGRTKLMVISADLKPRYVINQIILRAIFSRNSIHILLVPGLNVRLQSLVDFSCFAFVVDDDGWNQLSELNEWCREISRAHYPVPNMIVSYYEQRRRLLADDNDINLGDDTSMFIESVDEPENISNYHLHRDAGRRAFTPQNVANLKPVSYNVQTIKEIKSDFIALNLLDGYAKSATNHANKMSKIDKKRRTEIYQPLVIHKVQNSSGKRPNKKLNRKNRIRQGESLG